MPHYYYGVVRSHQAVQTAGCPLLRAEGGIHRPWRRPAKERLCELYQCGWSASTTPAAIARFCILIQGVDNPDQAPLRPVRLPQQQPRYSPN